MKKNLALSVGMLLVACTLFGCGKNKDSTQNVSNPDSTPKTSDVSNSSAQQGTTPTSSDWEVVPENTNPNLKYFGFFHSDGFLSQGSQLREIADLGMTNLFLINSASSIESVNEKLALTKELGHVATIGVPGVFKYGKQSVIGSATLASNYTQLIDEFTAGIKQYLEDGTVLGFYFDEPAWNGVAEEDFRKVTKYLREKWPDVRVMEAMTSYDIGISKHATFPEINASYNEYVTDVMYDNYGSWNDKERARYLDLLKSKATNNQAIWGIPRGFIDNPEQPDEIARAIRGIYTEALNEPRYQGIMSFSWCDGHEGDWGYGMKSFLIDTSEYYSKDLLKLYTDVGREVIGKDRIDWSSVPQLTLIPPTEVFDVGEKISIPPAGALDGNDNELPITYKITSPSGKDIPVGDFVAEESGIYTVTVSVDSPTGRIEKSCDVCVRYADEISLFDGAAYNQDAGGSDADIWCWPREVVTDFSHSGKGSLKVTPHATDGTWPLVLFQRNGYRLWDLTNADGISLWVYNPSSTALEKFGFIITDENEQASQNVFKVYDIAPGEWQELTISKSYIAANNPNLDLSKVVIKFGNAAPDYKNRTVFYIDDVMLTHGGEDIPSDDDSTLGFENDADLAKLVHSESDEWCWPRAISNEQAYSGNSSLKVTPHATDGTWPLVDFGTFDLSKAKEVSIMVYFDSEESLDTLGFLIGGVQQTVNLPSKTWTELKFDVSKLGDADKKEVSVKFGQLGATYTNRSPFYLDALNIIENEDVGPVDEGDTSTIGFENDTDLTKLVHSESDEWCWPRAISNEKSYTGSSSLKVTPHATDGTWPLIDFGTFDLSEYDEINMMVYFDGDEGLDTLGFNVNGIMETSALPAKEWKKISFSVSKLGDIDKKAISVKFGQLGAEYTNRSPFYIDSFNLVKYEDQGDTNGVISFENDADINKLVHSESDEWCWPRAISNEQACTGNASLKVTPHATDGTWPLVDFGTFDLSAAKEVSIMVYFDSEESLDTLGFLIGGVQQTVNLPSKTWTELKFDVSKLGNADKKEVSVKFGQLGATYTNRSPFYLDDLTIK